MDNQRSHRTPRDALEPQGPAEIMICEARMPEARGIDDVRIFLHVNILRKKTQLEQNRHPCRKGPPYASNKKNARAKNHEAKA